MKWFRPAALLLAASLLLASCSLPGEGVGPDSTQSLPAPSLPARSGYLDGISVVAEDSDSTGVGIRTSFLVCAPGSPGTAEMSQRFRLEPVAPFSLLAVEPSGGEAAQFRLHLHADLDYDTVYRLELLDDYGEAARSWAFQTRSPLRVTSATPGKNASGVDRRSGIELVFNRENVDIARHFSIDPPVEGEFFQYGRRAAFAPSQHLEYGETYQVTLSPGLAAADGSLLAEEFAFSFTVEQDPERNPAPASAELRGGIAENLLGDDPPVLPLSLSNLKGEQAVDVRVYSLSAEDYTGELARRGETDYYYDLTETGGLSPVLSFRENYHPETVTGTDGDGNLVESFRSYLYDYLVFPQALPLGYYLVEVRVEDPVTGESRAHQKLVQVNNTSVFLELVDGEAVAWLNDAATGEPLVGATVRLLDSETGNPASSAVTGEDGFALWESGLESHKALLRIPREGEPDYIALLSSGYDAPVSDGDASGDYQITLNTDREAYLNTDTARIWGVVRGRREPLPAEFPLSLELRQGYWYSGAEEPLSRKSAVLEGDGSFSAEFSFEDLVSGYYSIALLAEDGSYMGSSGFLVASYAKPRLTASASSSKAFYLPGEAVDMNLSVTYYDGTPAYGLPFLLRLPEEEREAVPLYYTPAGQEADQAVNSGQEEDQPIRAFTNERGSIHAQATPSSGAGWVPRTFSYRFVPTEATYEDGIEAVEGSALYFPSTLILRGEAVTPPGGETVVRVEANHLDTSRIVGGEVFTRDYPENILGDPAPVEISVTVTRHTYYSEGEMELVAQGYDWASKRTLYQYHSGFRCWTEKEVLASFDAVAEDGVLVVEGIPQEAEDNVTYTVELSARDENGRLVRQTVHLYPDFRPAFGEKEPEGEDEIVWLSSYTSYRFAALGAFRSGDGPYSSPSLKDGEEMEMVLVRQRRGVRASGRNASFHEEFQEEGRMLYLLWGDGMVQSAVGEDHSFPVAQSLEYKSHLRLWGAYFDGRRVFPVDGSEVWYDTSGHKLEVELSTDQAAYAPGDVLEVSARVADREGNPVASRVMLSVVDEAAFAVAPQYLDPLGDLFSTFSRHTSTLSHLSYTHRWEYYDSLAGPPEEGTDDDEPDMDNDGVNPAAGGGDGDWDPTIREDFRDTAAFLVLESGVDGRARAEIALPDNFTSWRITGAAVSREGLMAGHTMEHITVTSDLFVNLLYNETYLEGEDVGLSLTTQGSSLEGAAPIRYRVSVADSGGNTVAEAERKGRSDNAVEVNLGPLPPGEYTVTAAGRTNTSSDAIALPFSVAASRLELPVVHRTVLDSGETALDIRPLYYPVEVLFADGSYGNYLRTAKRLTEGYSNRFDSRVAAVAGREFLYPLYSREQRKSLERIPASHAQLDTWEYIEYGANSQPDLYRLYPYDSGDLELTVLSLVLSHSTLNHAASIRLEGYLPGGGEEEDGEPLLPLPEPDIRGDDEIGDIPPDEPVEAAENRSASLLSTPDEQAAALLGMAAQGKLVLPDLQERMAEPDLYTHRGRLYLIAALALLGDRETARQGYEAHVAPLLVRGGDYLRMPAEGDDAGYRDTACALLAASLLDHRDKTALADFLLDNRSLHYDPCMELAVYLGTYPGASGEGESSSKEVASVKGSSFRYTREGAVRTAYLKPGEALSLSLTREDLEAGGIQLLSGSVTATATYTGGEEEYALRHPAPESSPIHMERAIRPATPGDAERFGREDLLESGLEDTFAVTLRITMDRAAPLGSYTIREPTPSSLRAGGQARLSTSSGSGEQGLYSLRVDGQSRTYTLYHYPGEGQGDTFAAPETYEITYLARRIYRGSSRPEGVLVESGRGGMTLLLQPGPEIPEPGAGERKRTYRDAFLTTDPEVEDE